LESSKVSNAGAAQSQRFSSLSGELFMKKSSIWNLMIIAVDGMIRLALLFRSPCSLAHGEKRNEIYGKNDDMENHR
jgi:hypothetical protein